MLGNFKMVYSLVSSADYNQAAECFPIDARGRQCVPSCLMFLLYVNYVQSCLNIESCDLNEIMQAGSNLYCALRQCGLISGLVDPLKLPGRIFYKGETVYITHKGVLTGFIEDNVSTDGQVYHKFEHALLKASASGKNFIIVFNGVSVGLFLKESIYYIFDSHSRDDNGMSCSDGKCVLGAVKSLFELASFIRSLSRSVSHNSGTQFDLHTFSFDKRYKYTPFVIKIFNDTRGFKIETIHRRKRRNVETNNFPEKRQKMQKLLEGQSLSIHVDDRNADTCDKVIQDHIDEGLIEAESDSPSCNDICSNEINGFQNESLVSFFENLVSAGPDYVCSICTQTFFRHYMKNVSNLFASSKSSVSTYLTKLKSVDNCEWICKHCLESARVGKVPKYWVNNGLKFPQKPKELELSNLEERLVSPRLPFMQLREMPRGGQVNLKGNIVNVPADVNGTMKSLPRMMDENETIMLKLKRKLSYKHHVAFENIRPNKVFEAAKWLVGNSTLFRNEGITVNETWLQQTQAVPSYSDEPAETAMSSEQSGSDDTWIEENFMDRPTGNLDTCLQSLDFREFNQVLSVAPGENNTPLGLFQDLHSEVLSFPTIFCGQTRLENCFRTVPLHYSDICKWELRNVDRRVALCVPNIFFKMKRLQIKQIRDKVSLAVRKCKTRCAVFTAGEILTPGFVDKLTMQNDGYRVLRTLRGSPPYWEAAKRDVFAMIRQLGIPTWFCSFSAAETKWEPLLKSLAKLVQGKHLSSEEILNLSWQDKCQLIKSDPVTCARYFDQRVQTMIKHVLKHHSQPVGDIADFFYRVEFQQRGSPHIHMVIWVNGAPVHGVSSDAAVAAFVSKYVTCHKDDSIPSLINYQTHRHAQTCKKHGKSICRFNFPIPPMPETVVLHPLTDSEVPVEPGSYEKMISCLNELHQTQQEWKFEDFLQELQIDYVTYIQIVRSSISRPTVFLKRTVSECRINSYSNVLLRCWKANMDIQYILDPYSCVSYIVSYIAKGQRGLSNLLRDACDEARELDSDVRQQVRRIGNQFLSSVEIGAQEAAYLTLQLPLRRCTREVVFVDTKRPDDRTSLIKPMNMLKDLPSTSKNIEMDNVLKRYKRRPAVLLDTCYADFASWYDLCKGSKTDLCGQTRNGELPELDYEHDKDDDLLDLDENNSNSIIRYACGTRVRRRMRQKVIYSSVTPINHDREEHFREKIMLYTHWRDEEKDLIYGFETFEQSYYAKEEEINANKSKYEKNEDVLHERILENLHIEDFPSVHPQGQHENLLDEEEGTTTSVPHGCFDPGVGSDYEEGYDLGIDLGVGRRPVCLGNLPNREMDDEQYLQSVRDLNYDQKKIFYHILHKVKTQSLPFYTFLSGGAGCGKSVLIRALNQALLKYFNHLRSEDPNTSKLLLCAPTGKAAHNIGGCTIHSAFCIPASQGFHFKPLDMQQLNTMRAHYRDLKVIIIDEISMVGRGMLNFVNLRLQEIKGCTKAFGDVSVLAVGDLYQLKPVLDSWVFSQVYSSVQLQCMGTNLWVDLFDFFELKEIMRQKDDHAFALLLNRLREGEYTEEDLSVLDQRKIETLGLTNDSIKHMPHLFCTRADVATHNQTILSQIPISDKIEIEAIDTISGNIGISLHAQILSHLPLDPTKTMGLQKLLLLGLGMPAELCLNIDTTDGLTNGASCYIKKFDFRVKNSCRCSIVWVEFDDKVIGRCWRTKYKHLYQDGVAISWTPILETCRMFTYKYYKTYQIIRRQFPLYISAGKTIHKAQGSTIKGAVMHFGSKKVSHIHYVGLSRVTSLSELHILKLNPDKINVSPEVQAEMERLRTQRQITDFPGTMQTPNGIMKVCFQNCRSLRRHIEDVKHENTILSADIIALTETRLSGVLPTEFEIGGFQLLSSEYHQSAHGISIYYRNGLEIPFLLFKTVSSIEYALLIVHDNIVISFIYCPPKVANVANVSAFLSTFMMEVSELIQVQDAKLLLLGDFNFEYSECGGLVKLFHDRLGVRQLIDCVTTDYGSCLDHIYTNFPSDMINSFGTLESYYSDHKALYTEFSVHPNVCPLENNEN